MNQVRPQFDATGIPISGRGNPVTLRVLMNYLERWGYDHEARQLVQVWSNSPVAVSLFHACQVLFNDRHNLDALANKISVEERMSRESVLDLTLAKAAAFAEKYTTTGTPDATSDKAIDWNEYRDERLPNGELLTAKSCKDRYTVSGTDLSNDNEAKKNRLKNPAGRKGGDHVYRYLDVLRIAHRKGDSKPPSLEELAKRRDRIRSERK